MYLYTECLFWQEHAQVRWPTKAIGREKKKVTKYKAFDFFLFPIRFEVKGS